MRRAADIRPVVRKSAIQALEAILLSADRCFESPFSVLSVTLCCSTALATLSPDDLQVFYDGCLDASVGNRST